MGKNLIIKGADFENNTIIGNIDITEIIGVNFVKGKNGITVSNTANRGAIFPRIDLTSYKAQGYHKIEVIVKVANCVTSFLCGSLNGNVSGGRYLQITLNSETGSYTVDMENTWGYYFGANFALDVANLNNFSDYCQVILKP